MGVKTPESTSRQTLATLREKRALGPCQQGCLKELVWQVTLPCMVVVLQRESSFLNLASFLSPTGHNSMIFKCFVSQPFSMENQGDRAMIATGSFEERDTFREA